MCQQTGYHHLCGHSFPGPIICHSPRTKPHALYRTPLVNVTTQCPSCASVQHLPPRPPPGMGHMYGPLPRPIPQPSLLPYGAYYGPTPVFHSQPRSVFLYPSQLPGNVYQSVMVRTGNSVLLGGYGGRVFGAGAYGGAFGGAAYNTRYGLDTGPLPPGWGADFGIDLIGRGYNTLYGLDAGPLPPGWGANMGTSGRGYNTLHGFDTGPLPPGWDTGLPHIFPPLAMPQPVVLRGSTSRSPSRPATPPAPQRPAAAAAPEPDAPGQDPPAPAPEEPASESPASAAPAPAPPNFEQLDVRFVQ